MPLHRGRLGEQVGKLVAERLGYRLVNEEIVAHAASYAEVASRRRTQPAPPRVLFEALTQPDRDPARPWLHLRADEQRPTVVEAVEPHLVVWSSLWRAQPDARIRFDLPNAGYETGLRWTLLVDGPAPQTALVAHMKYRLNTLINANLRYTFGQ